MIHLDMTFEDLRVQAKLNMETYKYSCTAMDCASGKEFDFELDPESFNAMTSLMVLGDDDPNAASHYEILEPLLDILPDECRMVP